MASTVWNHPLHGAFLQDLGPIVHWIEPDVNNFDYIFVAIEAGALVQSHDGGRTWIDRVEQGPYDTHTMATHKKAPRRLYSAAGDGYFESFDYGKSWNSPTEGLRHITSMDLL